MFLDKTKIRAWDKNRQIMTVFCLKDIYANCYGNVGFLEGAPHRHENDSWDDFVLMASTCLFDNQGKEIFEDDILEFNDEHGIWRSRVVFERGLFGIDVCNPIQVKNPDGWNKSHNKIESRSWGCTWGYEEFGTAFTYHQPLAQITVHKGSSDTYKNSELKKLNEKFGYDKYYVLAKVVGNVHENPELIIKK